MITMLRIIAVLFVIATVFFTGNECRPRRECGPTGVCKDAFQLRRQAYPSFHDLVDRESKRLFYRQNNFEDAHRREEEMKVIQPETTLPPPDCIGLACFMHQYKDYNANLNRQ